MTHTIPSFCIGTTLYICMTVLSLLCRYFHYFEQRKLPCLLFYVNMPILIDKALKHFYKVQESLILCKHRTILLSLTLKENTISNTFTIYILQKYLPKRESTHKNVQSCPSNKKRELLYSYFLLIYFSEFNDSFFVKYATIAEVEVEKQQTDKQLDDTLKHLPNKQPVKTNKYKRSSKVFY